MKFQTMCIRLMTLTSVNDASPCQHTQNLSQIDRVCFGRRPTLAKPNKNLVYTSICLLSVIILHEIIIFFKLLLFEFQISFYLILNFIF